MKSKKVFKESSEWWKNAIVDDSYVTKASYSIGYKKAGDILANHILEDRLMMDAVFLPICYCYRHFIELSLKESIIDVARLINSGCYEYLPEGVEYNIGKLKIELANCHSLARLWNELEKRMGIAIDVSDAKRDARIKGYIIDFHHKDVKSQTFRYPLDKEGKSHFENVGRYDIENVKSCVDELEFYFSALGGYVSDQINACNEFHDHEPLEQPELEDLS